jgi:hypothetical protein
LGLNGIIFHDKLSDDFVNTYENENIRFIRYEVGSRSNNDERFICYYAYLLERKDVGKVLLTDLFDVEIKKNPFEIIDKKKDFYLGSEEARNNKRWMKRIYRKAYGEIYYGSKKLLNAGIIGGRYENVIGLLGKMIKEFDKIDSEVNANMAVLNKCVYDLTSEERILTGRPLHSLYKKYEKNGDYYIKHK